MEDPKELAEGFIKLCNVSNKDVSLFKIKAATDLINKKEIRICGSCLSSNCYKKQTIATKNKMEKRFLHDCKGKILTLGEVPEALKKIQKNLKDVKNNKNFRGKKPQTNGSTASIKPSEENVGDTEDEAESFTNAFFSKRQENKVSFGFGCHNVQASILPLLNEDTIPNWEE